MQLCDFEVGLDRPLFLIAGPCVIESEGLILDIAGQLKTLTDELGIPFIFKSSFDKANRSSHQSFRGPGMEAGLEALAKVKSSIGVPVLTDVHEDTDHAERARLSKEIGRREQEVKRLEGKLGNASFVDKAPKEVVDKERQKLADAEAALSTLREQLASFEGAS